MPALSLPAYNVVLLPLIGIVGGVVAGMVGSGGGVLVLSMLIYLAFVPIKVATGISAAQYFFGAVSGVIAHRRSRNVDMRVGLVMLVTGILLAQVGALLSVWMSDLVLKLLYLLLAVCAATSLLFPTHDEQAGRTAECQEKKPNLVLATALGMLVGLASGILGVGGGFLMVPLLVYALQMPMRQAIGTSLFVIAGTTASAIAGKIIQGQVPFFWSLMVTVGAVGGAQVGARLSGQYRPSALRKMLSVMLFLVCVRIVVDIITQFTAV